MWFEKLTGSGKIQKSLLREEAARLTAPVLVAETVP